MRRVAILGFACVLAWTARTQAADEAEGQAYVHVVRPGETLASIAQLYYGDARRESVLVAENGLAGSGGGAIVVGMRLLVPWATYHVVKSGESWAELAQRYYGDARRAFVLVEANRGATGTHPDVGAELIVPYPVRYVAVQGELVPKIAAQFYEADSGTRRLRRFNSIGANRLSRGQLVLVPLEDLVLSPEGREIVQQRIGTAPAAGELRARQAEIEARLPELRRLADEGSFADAIALGNRLLGVGKLTGNQVVTIQRQLATAYVALGRSDLAVRAFRAALEKQPDLELDALRTSPKVLVALREAKTQRDRETAKHARPE